MPIPRAKSWFLLFAFLLLAGCAAIERPPTPSPTPSPLPHLTATPTAAPPTTLRVWLPASLAPDQAPTAADLLIKRIQAFAADHNLTAEIRFKPLAGEAALLPSLNAARMVAPEAVPDIALLPRHTLEAAAIKGLAFPLPEGAFTAPLSAPDWFPYAQNLAVLQGVTYGVPFGGDALGLLYHPEALAEPPATWSAWLQADFPWLLPLGDPQGQALLALYHTAGGCWSDDEGRPAFDEDAVRQTLSLLVQAQQKGLLDAALLQISSDAMLWERYQSESTALMVTHVTHLLNGPNPRRIAPLPAGPDGEAAAFADGLLWALTTPNPTRQNLGVALMADLGAPDFVAQWTEAAGYLPPRQSVLVQWQNSDHRDIAQAIIPTLQPAPPQPALTVLGPLLQQAAAQVLTGQQTPTSAAQWLLGMLAQDGG